MPDLPIPKVTVIVPCWNYQDCVAETIESIREQDLTNFECIIVNDGSTDDSKRVIETTIAKDKRFRLIDKQNSGVAIARSTGISVARGQYVVCIDADDTIEPAFLRTLSRALDADRNLGIAYSALKIMGMDGVSPWPPPNFDLDGQLQHNNQIPTCAMFRRADFYRVGGYRSYMQPAEDADFFTRLLIYTGKTAKRVTDAALFHYRVHEESLSRTLKVDPYRQRPTITAYKTRPLPLPPPKDFPHASNPVRHYDAPLVAVVIEGRNTQEIYATLDSLENQTLSQWVAFVEDAPLWRGAPFVKVGGHTEAQQAAPFQLNIKSGTILEATYLQRAFEEKSLMTTCCGGSVKLMTLESMNNENSVLIEYISDKLGKHPVTGSATRTNYHMHRPGDHFEVFRADAEATPERFRIISEEPLAVVIPPVAPLPAEPKALLVEEPIVTVNDAPPVAFVPIDEPAILEADKTYTFNVTPVGNPQGKLIAEIRDEYGNPMDGQYTSLDVVMKPRQEPPTIEYTQEPISTQALKEIIEAQRAEQAEKSPRVDNSTPAKKAPPKPAGRAAKKRGR